MIRLIIAVALCSIVGGRADAQSLPDKLCGIALAQKLPNVPGASITAFSFKPLDKRQALSRIVGRLSLQAAANELDRAFSFLDARMIRMIENPYSAGGPEKVRADLVDAATNVVSDAIEVNADYQAGGMRIVYAGSCVRGANGSVSAALDGALR